MIVGLTGHGQAGKDTVGVILQEEHGFTLTSPTQAMRELLYWLNPWIKTPENNSIRRFVDLIDENGYERAKLKYPEVLRLLQQLGSGGTFDVLGRDVWSKAMHDVISGHTNVAITSVRKMREDAYFKLTYGDEYRLWRIRRLGCGKRNDHPVEREIDILPATDLWNDGTVDDLAVKVQALLGA